MAGARVMQCVGPSYQLADRQSASQRAVNLYLRQIEGFGEERRVILASAPGLRLLADLGAEVRGIFSRPDDVDRQFAVAGSQLLEVMADGTTAARGTLATSTGDVYMDLGRDQLIVCDGPNGYVLHLSTNTFSQITDTDWRGSIGIAVLDGYAVFVPPDSDQFYISAIDDASSFDALDFSSADTEPDKIVAFKAIKRELYFFGAVSTEVWVNSGDADFPFSRYNSTPIDVGAVSRRSVCVVADTLVWVGRTRRGTGFVYEMQGHQPVRISTQAVEEAIARCTDKTAIRSWAYQDSGNEFAAFTGPGMETTWVFDFSTREWHERGEFTNEAGWSPLRVQYLSFAHDRQVAAAGTKLYVLDHDHRYIDGAPLVRERTWPHLIAPDLEPRSYQSLELLCKTGEGGRITLEFSNDGGYVYQPPLIRSLGSVGQRTLRVRWMALGAAVDRVFRLRVSDPVDVAIYGATVQAG